MILISLNCAALTRQLVAGVRSARRSNASLQRVPSDRYVCQKSPVNSTKEPYETRERHPLKYAYLRLTRIPSVGVGEDAQPAFTVVKVQSAGADTVLADDGKEADELGEALKALQVRSRVKLSMKKE